MPNEDGLWVASGICLFSFVEALVSVFLTRVMLRKARVTESLGERLDKYAHISLIRFSMLSSGSLMLMIAFYLSDQVWIPVAYGIYLLFSVAAWPTRSRVCVELKLNLREAEVLYGK